MTSSAPFDISVISHDLLTVGDLIRFSATLLHRHGVSFGQGTVDALGEAEFLVLERLGLPLDTATPFMGARLTKAERQDILELLEKRLVTRTPAAYLLNAAYCRDFRFYVDERVIIPRSFLAEILLDGTAPIDPDAWGESPRILDLCTGSGCLAIIAAHVFPDATLDAVDLSADALAVARRNVDDYKLQDQITLYQGNLMDPLPGHPYDLIICNPPYVPAARVAAFPPEHAAEPTLAHGAGADGLDVITRVVDAAPRFLKPQSGLLMEIGAARRALAAARPDLPYQWLDTTHARGEVFYLDAATL
jgi:ribosomal protein L3 glutamine methyltransferase